MRLQIQKDNKYYEKKNDCNSGRDRISIDGMYELKVHE